MILITLSTACMGGHIKIIESLENPSEQPQLLSVLLQNTCSGGHVDVALMIGPMI
jgi:hypothetical protein